MRNIWNVSVGTALPFESCFVVRAMCFHYKVRLMPEGFDCGFFESKKTFGARQKPGDGWAGGEGGETVYALS